MRLYTFSNFYLSPIQIGIQTAHVVSELFAQYCRGEVVNARVLMDWTANHKTIICLNGGNNAGVLSTYERLEVIGERLRLPYAKFHEDEQSLGGIVTCCGIVVPQTIYDHATMLRATPEYISQLTDHEEQLALLLNQYSLAR